MNASKEYKNANDDDYDEYDGDYYDDDDDYEDEEDEEDEDIENDDDDDNDVDDDGDGDYDDYDQVWVHDHRGGHTDMRRGSVRIFFFLIIFINFDCFMVIILITLSHLPDQFYYFNFV